MIKLSSITLLMLGVIFLHAQSYYPDSAHVMGYTRFWAATGEASGNRVSVRDSYGNIHAVYCYRIGGPYADSGEVFYVYSTDNGTNWSVPENLSRTDTCTSTEPNIVVDSQDRLHCVWKQLYTDTSTTYYDYDMYYSQKGSTGWTPAVNISNLSLGANGCYSSMVADSRDHVHVVYDMSVSSGNWDIYYSYYNDTVWSEPYMVSNTPYDDAGPALAIDHNDNLHLVWRQRTTNGPIMYSYYNGISWTPAEVIASFPGAQSGGPCIVGDSQNHLHVIWCSIVPPSDSTDIYYTTFDGVAWSTPLNLSNTVQPSAYSSLAIDSLDNLYVVWSEKTPFPNQEIYYRTYNGTTWSGIMNLTQDTSLSWCPKLGNPVKSGAVDLVWVDSWAGTRSVMYMGLNLTSIAEDAPGYNPGASLMLCIHPNPFCDRVAIGYACEGTSQSRISIYDATGRLVRQWSCPDTERSGRILWQGDDEHGCVAVPGVYFIRIEGGGYSAIKKIIKIK